MNDPHISSIHSDELQRLIGAAERDGRPPEVLERLRWFLAFAENRNISRVCDEFQISRSTFYRWARRFDRGDLSSLEDEKVSFPASLRPNPTPAKGRVWALILASLLAHATIALGSRLFAQSAQEDGGALVRAISGRQFIFKNCLPDAEGDGWTCSVQPQP